MSVHDHVEDFGRTVGEELLEPTRIYARTISNLRRDFRIYGISHITGGGLIDNPPRILPSRVKAVIDRSAWTPHPIFQFIQREGRIPDHDMMLTFNNGLGMLIVVSEEETDEVIVRLRAMGEAAYCVGTIESRDEDEDSVQFIG